MAAKVNDDKLKSTKKGAQPMVTQYSLRVTAGLASAVFISLVLRGAAIAQEAFSTVSTVHFEVKYQRGVTEDAAKKTADFLQKEYEFMSNQLGLDLKKKLEVRIYDTIGKYLSKTNQRKAWRGAIYWRHILHLQPVEALEARKIFEQSLSYELALAVLEQTSGKGCRRWLQEAYAVYHSGEMTNLTPPIGTKLSAFSDLDQDIQQYPNPPQREDVHYILGATMKFFVEQYGEEKTFGLFKKFDGMTTTETLFKKQFKQEFRTIERTWANYIDSLTESFKNKSKGE
jgi:hypothetical protein